MLKLQQDVIFRPLKVDKLLAKISKYLVTLIAAAGVAGNRLCTQQCSVVIRSIGTKCPPRSRDQSQGIMAITYYINLPILSFITLYFMLSKSTPHFSLLREQREVRERCNQEEQEREEKASRERVFRQEEEAEKKKEEDHRKRDAVAEYR